MENLDELSNSINIGVFTHMSIEKIKGEIQIYGGKYHNKGILGVLSVYPPPVFVFVSVLFLALTFSLIYMYRGIVVYENIEININL